MEPSVPDKSGSITLSGWGIIPKIFFFELSIPAILLDEPLGLKISLISPFSPQYLKAMDSVSSRLLIILLFAK